MARLRIRDVLLGCASSTAFVHAAYAQATPTPDPAPMATPAPDSAPMATGQATNADAAPLPEDDMIVVSGFRRSLELSVATKRESLAIVEVITAEDIAKLPDVSIAESLGRLPGLATQRVNGRSQVLSIRGLGPDLSTALLNGREQVSTGDNRGVEFDQYPAELLSSVVVYKTPFAGLIGQGLAGTVDLRTIRPLEKTERVLSISGRYEFNEDGSLNPDAPGDGFRVTGTYIDQFLDNTLGVAIGVAYQSSPTQTELFNSWGYGGDADGNALIGGAKPYVQSNDLDRFGVLGVLEYKPTDRFRSAIDVYYSDFAEQQPLRGIEFPLGFGGGFGVEVNSIDDVEDGFVNAGSFRNVRGVVRNDLNERRADLFSIGWNTRFEPGPWGLELDISYSRANRSDRLIESYSGTGYGADGGAADTLGFSRTGDGIFRFEPRLLDYSDTNRFVLTDPLGWGAGNDVVQAGFINAPDTRDELLHLRAAVDHDLEFRFIKKVEIGFDYGAREKERDINQQFLTLAGQGLSLAGGSVRELPIPQGALLSQTGLGFLGIPNQVTYDPLFLLNNGVYAPLSVALSSFAVAQDWTINEDTYTAWIKFGVDGEIGDVTVKGDFGLQVVTTDQSSVGFQIPTSGIISGTLDAAALAVTDGLTYTDYLPSMNLIFGITPTTQIRFGAARTLARARPDQLNASLSLGVNLTRLTVTDPNQSAFSATGGNARLRPFISNQVDLTFEKYFGGEGYFSVALFYKDLESFVNPNDSFLFDFSEFVAGSLTPAQAAQLGTPLGIISGPSNNGSGYIQGVEVSLSLPGRLLGGPFENFGLLTSGSFTDSEVTLFSRADPSDGVSLAVPGLSKYVVNSTLYFEKSGFEARVSHRFRSSFLAEVSGISATRVLRTAEEESIVDAQIGYAFKKGRANGLRLTFQALNLTDEPFVTFDGDDPRRVIDYQTYGRTYLVGGSFTF